MLGDVLFDAIREAVREELQAANGQGARKEEPYVDVKEAARLARLSPSTIRLRIRQGDLASKSIGRRVVIKRSDLDRFLDMHTKELPKEA
jgi:excisionase family DNA binding protein